MNHRRQQASWWRGLAIAALLSAAPVAEAKWKTFPDCRLIPNDANDGDSFHTKRGRRHDIFRLYYVDSAETDRSLEDRIDDQADYWRLPPERMHGLGEEAKTFTANYLKNGFTVHTEFEDARGNSDRKRSFAFIETEEGDLAEALVDAGLARIYGRMVAHPDGTKESRYLARLRNAERSARANHRGAWGYSSAKTNPASTPGAESAAAPAPLQSMNAWTNVPPQTRVLANPVTLYSLRTSAAVGTLSSGTTVQVLKAESPTMLRVRFLRDEKVFEAKCRRSELGL